ncbi:hypothetical protein GGTG_11923 [Gaeumannomyces tritici R3-111a-1]|uniref:Uncharacterized protein n=1 Tax=Gaeumannomyces tritici (strain R3-111a-1) TaxID=644352 RepID=J3PEJ2_GAET3|nr:hypothetical protein GGTG_11923 [Gaeumannomyces tritici R3-111a-1]EJT70900.1 hypothetical protein GGTG_11923 [Gaeumannomyces tritici R3-111a-1]
MARLIAKRPPEQTPMTSSRPPVVSARCRLVSRLDGSWITLGGTRMDPPPFVRHDASAGTSDNYYSAPPKTPSKRHGRAEEGKKAGKVERHAMPCKQAASKHFRTWSWVRDLVWLRPSPRCHHRGVECSLFAGRWCHWVGTNR